MSQIHPLRIPLPWTSPPAWTARLHHAHHHKHHQHKQLWPKLSSSKLTQTWPMTLTQTDQLTGRQWPWPWWRTWPRQQGSCQQGLGMRKGGRLCPARNRGSGHGRMRRFAGCVGTRRWHTTLMPSPVSHARPSSGGMPFGLGWGSVLPEVVCMLCWLWMGWVGQWVWSILLSWMRVCALWDWTVGGVDGVWKNRFGILQPRLRVCAV